MRAAVITTHDNAGELTFAEVPTPTPGDKEVLVQVKATAINRADILQRKGLYPAPAGVPKNICGLEFAGTVVAIDKNVQSVKVGDRVFGLVGGGSYAEYVAVDYRTVVQIPEQFSYVQAAAIPEAFLTAYDAMICQGELLAGEFVLISAAASGVGLAAIQIALAHGAIPIGTSRSAEKLNRLAAYGLQEKVQVVEGDSFSQRILEITKGHGFDVCLELVGGSYINEDLKCAALKARILLVGLLAGNKTSLELGKILTGRLRLIGTTMRARPLTEKITVASILAQQLCPLFTAGKFVPTIDRVYPFAEVAAAQALVESNYSFGKVVLEL